MAQIRSILVVGGGTAGWLSAAFLQRTLNGHPGRPVQVTLVESPEQPAIGVGEATVPTLRQTLATLGITETTLFARTDATLKNGIRFAGWRVGSTPGEPPPEHFDHPFDTPLVTAGYSAMVHWLNLYQRGLTHQPYADCGSIQTALFDRHRSAKQLHTPDYDAPLPYAYHLDALKLAALLRDTATGRGVQHLLAEVQQVHTSPEGITGVGLADGRQLQADLYVDCSGFSARLIGQALQVPWQPMSEHLLCDRAVACPVAPAEGGRAALRPYTTATAQASGWTWEIDLVSRTGTGHVFSSAHCSDDEAVATLLRQQGGRERLAEPRLLPMRVGHHSRAWEKNCLSVGLASGFIEPLESTGIYLVEHALKLFLDHLPGADAAANGLVQAQYNRLMAAQYEELRNFIALHYVASPRRDTPFWRDATAAQRVPPGLARLLALWAGKVPHGTDLDQRQSLFGAHNHFFILAGLGRLPAAIGQAAHLDPATSRQVLDQVARVREAALRQSPPMADLLKKLRGATDHAPSGLQGWPALGGLGAAGHPTRSAARAEPAAQDAQTAHKV